MKRVAVVGIGKIGVVHAAVISTLPNARLAAVVDHNPGLRHYARSLLGAEIPLYASLPEAIDRSRIDAAFLCTPAFTHYPLAKVCVERGVHVFCEKPLAHTLEDAQRLYALVRDRNVLHAVGYMKTHYPHYQRMKELLVEGAIGTPLECRADVRMSQVLRPARGWVYSKPLSGGGVLINSGCHALALLNEWLPALRITSGKARRIHSKEVEDEFELHFTFAGGGRGVLQASWSLDGFPVETTEIEIVGSRGRMHAHDAGVTRTGDHPPGEIRLHRSQVDRAAFDVSPEYGGEGYYNEDEEFIRCCETGGRPRVTFEEGLQVQQLLDAAYRSAESQGRQRSV